MNGSFLFLCIWMLAISSLRYENSQAQPQVHPDTASNRFEIEIKPRVYPEALFSTTFGIGIGVGLEIQNLLRGGSSLLLLAQPSVHRGLYTASFFTGNPYEERLFGYLGAGFVDTGRQRYWGLGPFTDRSDLVHVEHERFELEGRIGYYLKEGALLIQPSVKFVHQTVQDFTERNEDAIENMDPISVDHLYYVTDERNDRILRAAYGVELILDHRDRLETSRRGTLLEAEVYRYNSLNRPGPSFQRYLAAAYWFLPVTTRSTLGFRAVSILTRNDGPDPIPFYMLVPLDRHLIPGYPSQRFFSNDILAFGVEYGHQLLSVFQDFGLEGIVSLHAAGAYHNVFKEFEPGLTFRKTLNPEERQFYLRPTVGIGARILSLRRDRAYITGMAALSAEGISFLTLRFIHDLRRRTTPIR